MKDALWGHDLINNMTHELSELVSYLKENIDNLPEMQDENSELRQIIEDADRDMDRYYEYADAIDECLQDIMIEGDTEMENQEEEER